MAITLQNLGAALPPLTISKRVDEIDPPWELATVARELSAAVLREYPAFAGVPVETERVDPLPTVPLSGPPLQLIVYGDTEASTRAQAGPVPHFEVTMHLVVQAIARTARLADARSQIDAMVAGIKDCLLKEPIWVEQIQTVTSMRDSRTARHEGDTVLFDGRVQIDCTWPEKYKPRITQPLSTITIGIVPGVRQSSPPVAPTTVVTPTTDIRSTAKP